MTKEIDNKYTYSFYRISIIHIRINAHWYTYANDISDRRQVKHAYISAIDYNYIRGHTKLYFFFHDSTRWSSAKDVFLPIGTWVTAFVFLTDPISRQSCTNDQAFVQSESSEGIIPLQVLFSIVYEAALSWDPFHFESSTLDFDSQDSA